MTFPKMEEADFYDARPEGFHVGSWCPTPQPTVPPTQVHLSATIGPIRALWRFKGTDTLDSLIAALIDHRVDVWGAPDDESVWMVRRG